jgi:hydroxyacylglutathione hydrolase
VEIRPGIHRIDGLQGVNCYLIVSEAQILLVDTGLPGQAKKTIHYVEKLGRKAADIQYILLTHADIDHAGCAKDLRELTGARVAIHRGDVPVLTGQRKLKTVNNSFKPIVALIMGLMRFQTLEPDIVLEDQQIIAGWQVVHCPGHTQGSLCLYQPGGSLFAGDALRTNSRGVPRPISSRVCLDAAQMRQSLRMLANLEYNFLMPGHGAPILDRASLRVQDMVTRYFQTHQFPDGLAIDSNKDRPTG